MANTADEAAVEVLDMDNAARLIDEIEGAGRTERREKASAGMRPGPLPSRRNTALLVARYLLLLAVIIAAMRAMGRGWIGAITAGLVFAGVLCTLLILVGSDRHG